MSHKSKVRVAIVGCGYWGPNLIRNFLENDQCVVVTVCDKNSKKLAIFKKRHPLIRVTIDFSEVLKDPSIDAVALATPIPLHFSFVRQALLAGKHVYVEKPMAHTLRHAETLLKLSHKVKKVLMVGHTFLFSPPVIKIKELLDKKELGKLYFINMTRVNLGIHQSKNNVLWDLAPHDLSILIYWLEEQPIRVTAFGRDCLKKGLVDVAYLCLQFPSGIIANLNLSWLAPGKIRSSVLVGSKKMVLYDDTHTERQIQIFNSCATLKDPKDFGEYQLTYRTGDVLVPHLSNVEPLSECLRHFIECIQKNKTPKTNAEHALNVIKIIDAAQKKLKVLDS